MTRQEPLVAKRRNFRNYSFRLLFSSCSPHASPVESASLRVAAPPPKPLMIFDGDCGFCRRWIARWQGLTGEAVDYIPFQDASVAARFPEIPREEFEQAVQLVLPNGAVYAGASAVLHALAAARRERWLLWLYLRLPVFTFFADLLYAEVAAHREFLSRVDRALHGGRPGWPRSFLIRWLFLRGLALVYLAAFVSLATQVHGLLGHQGISPADRLVAAVKHSFADQRLSLFSQARLFPTLARFGAGDRALDWMCGAGIALSIALFCGLAPAPVLFLLWLVYLSLCSIGSPFLDFQWDMLLLETGFLAIFLAPLQLFERPSRQAPPSVIVLWLLRWLLFRLMLESGCVKLLSGDPLWWNLTALGVHFQTQPLPTWIAWYAQHLPPGVLRAATAAMFVIELGGPALIFAGRRFRLVAAALFFLLQLIILLTGNYTFFNVLAILLCLPLLDDEALFFLARRFPAPAAPSVRRRWPTFVTVPLFLWTVLVTSIPLLGSMGSPPWSRFVTGLYLAAEPFRSFNGYGLFAVMTPVRPEIIVEGSNDGAAWLPYEFKYKPGDVNRRPAFVAPFQPRLDWQMWFAALGRAQDPRNQWFLEFEFRLLQNSKPVVDLLAKDPFAPKAPKYIRAQLYEYQFTSEAQRKATGAWWSRKYLGAYAPALSLQNFEQP